jgi:hypothetical protein
MTTIEMKLADVQGLALAMSQEETRYCLSGIHLLREPGADMVTATATDGHRLHSVRFAAQLDDAEGFNTIIPGYLVRSFLKVHKPKRGNDTFTISINKIEGINHIEMQSYIFIDKVSLKSRDVDGTFPSIERVLPREISDTRGTKEGFGLNPSYVADAVQFMAGLKPKRILPIVWQTEGITVIVGHSAADVTAARDYVAGQTGKITLVMPVRA